MKNALCILLMPLATIAAEPRTIHNAEHTVIYRKAGQYSAFPRLMKLADGTLHLQFGARVT